MIEAVAEACVGFRHSALSGTSLRSPEEQREPWVQSVKERA